MNGGAFFGLHRRSGSVTPFGYWLACWLPWPVRFWRSGSQWVQVGHYPPGSGGGFYIKRVLWWSRWGGYGPERLWRGF